MNVEYEIVVNKTHNHVEMFETEFIFVQDFTK